MPDLQIDEAALLAAARANEQAAGTLRGLRVDGSAEDYGCPDVTAAWERAMLTLAVALMDLADGAEGLGTVARASAERFASADRQLGRALRCVAR